MKRAVKGHNKIGNELINRYPRVETAESEELRPSTLLWPTRTRKFKLKNDYKITLENLQVPKVVRNETKVAAYLAFTNIGD